MTEIYITTFKGVKIVYSDHSRQFVAYEVFEGEDRQIGAADTQEGAEQMINAHLRAAFGKPIAAVDVDHDREVKITSRDVRSTGNVYVTWKDGDTTSRSSEAVVNRYWHDNEKPPTYCFVRATPENLAILARIQATHAELNLLEEKIKNMRKEYTSHVTEKDVGMAPKGEEQ